MTPDSIISENLTLLSMPEIVIRLNSLLDDPNCSATDIGNEIGLDPALTVRVLKIINSAIYNLPKQVNNIPTAISLLGNKHLRDIVMTTSVIKKFQSIPADLVNMNSFWCHSICCAIASRLIAKTCQIQAAEDFFVMGLLHDIGKLVMYLVLPDQSREVLRKVRELNNESPDADITKVEKSLFGFSHATLGRVLTQEWNMPDTLTTPIAEHHLLFSQFAMPKATAILKIADYISNQIQPPISLDEIQELDQNCLDCLNIDEKQLLDLQQQADEILQKTMSLVYQ